ncbi:VOC family protein [Microbacterium jepli]|uniref:VOC family protein n=1 Tax=Microbacterium sp. 1P10UE TaxID=3132288 RepID=UPI0039A24041
MALHRLASVTIGVPNVTTTLAYYRDFGLTVEEDGWLSTLDGGRQMRIIKAPRRQLLELVVGADNDDDIARIRRNLKGLALTHGTAGDTVWGWDPGTGVRAVVRVEPRIIQRETPVPAYNGPGSWPRIGERHPGIVRSTRVQPRKLGHTVLGTPNFDASYAFFADGLGFKVSDRVKDHGVFLRCSIDHHNLLLQKAPVAFLHHTSWQVDDVDDVGRGAVAMLEDHPERHVWGLGRHYAGSNFFWYLKDPAGNFSEYYSDMDCIIDDQLWTPETLEGARGMYLWGPPPPPSFITPEDLAEQMIGVHG